MFRNELERIFDREVDMKGQKFEGEDKWFKGTVGKKGDSESPTEVAPIIDIAPKTPLDDSGKERFIWWLKSTWPPFLMAAIAIVGLSVAVLVQGRQMVEMSEEIAAQKAVMQATVRAEVGRQVSVGLPAQVKAEVKKEVASPEFRATVRAEASSVVKEITAAEADRLRDLELRYAEMKRLAATKAEVRAVVKREVGTRVGEVEAQLGRKADEISGQVGQIGQALEEMNTLLEKGVRPPSSIRGEDTPPIPTPDRSFSHTAPIHRREVPRSTTPKL